MILPTALYMVEKTNNMIKTIVGLIDYAMAITGLFVWSLKGIETGIALLVSFIVGGYFLARTYKMLVEPDHDGHWGNYIKWWLRMFKRKK